ncbi:hypothetical protein AAC387_Pa03g0445 [Persea americana]
MSCKCSADDFKAFEETSFANSKGVTDVNIAAFCWAVGDGQVIDRYGRCTCELVMGRRMMERSVAMNDMNGDGFWCSIEPPFLFDQVA